MPEIIIRDKDRSEKGFFLCSSLNFPLANGEDWLPDDGAVFWTKPSRENFPVDGSCLNFLLQSGNALHVSDIQNKLGVTDFVSGMTGVENYLDFEKFLLVVQHGLQGFIGRNIEGE